MFKFAGSLEQNRLLDSAAKYNYITWSRVKIQLNNFAVRVASVCRNTTDLKMNIYVKTSFSLLRIILRIANS